MNKGFVPNFQDGSFESSIAAGISAIKQINETVVAAIARSVTTALADLGTGGAGKTEDILNEVVRQLTDLNDTLDEVNIVNTQIQANTAADTGAGGAAAPTPGGSQDVAITLQTNQNTVVTVTGLESLRDQIAAAIRDNVSDQVEQQIAEVLEALDSVITTLQERGILSSFIQPK